MEWIGNGQVVLSARWDDGSGDGDSGLRGKTPWSPHQNSFLGDGAVSSTSVKQQFRSSGGDTLGFQQKVRLFFQLISVQFSTGRGNLGSWCSDDEYV